MAAEASVAIGIASSAIAFFNFATKVAQTTKAIHDAGGELPEDVQLCYTLVQDFSKLLKRLKNGVQQSRVTPVPQEAEADFEQLIEGCSVTVQELLLVLQSLAPTKSPLGRVRWLAKLRSGIKIARKEGNIQRIQSRLRSYKEQLLLLMLEQMLDSSSTTKSAVRQLHEHEVVLHAETQHEHREIVDSVVSQDRAFVGLQSSVVHFESSLSQLRSGSDEGLAIARQILEVAHAGRMDPNYIYIAIPKLPLSPLPIWYSCLESLTQRLAEATRRLRLPSSGPFYPSEPLVLVKQKPGRYHSDRSSPMTLRLALKGDPRSTTLQLDMGGEMTDTRFIELLARAYTDYAGWKPWLTLQRLSCLRFTQMMILADQEIQMMRDSTRERRLSRNFIDWYTYQSSLESEHYYLPWFQYPIQGGSNPSETSTPISTCGFEKPSVGHPIVEEVDESPGISEQEEIQEILRYTSRTRHTRRDQGIGQPLVKLLPETLRHDSQRLGMAKEELLWSVELDGDFDWNTLWWILMVIGSFVSYYIYPGLEHLLHFYAENLQARLIDAGCLRTLVVPHFESSLLSTAFTCGLMSGNTSLLLLISLHVGQRLIPEHSELGAWRWPRASDTQTHFGYIMSASLPLAPIILWALGVGIQRNGWWSLEHLSPSGPDRNLSWTSALFFGALTALSKAMFPTRFYETPCSSLERICLPKTWDIVAIKTVIIKIVPLIFITGWTLNLFQIIDAFRETLGPISPVCALENAGVKLAQKIPILVRTLTLVALDIASRFLVRADLACSRTAKGEGPRRELNVYAFGIMVVLVAFFIATFRW